jgi:hypothetical protein
MANRGRHEFTVQEAVNMDSFVSWNYEELDLSGTDTATFISVADPAKKVVIYDKPGQTASFLEEGDVLSLTINGASGSGVVKIDRENLPFTITGLMVTSLSVANSAASAGDAVSVLSFH